LVHISETAGYPFPLLRSVIDSNDRQYDRMAAKVRHAAGGSLDGVTVAVWGITFKAGTDDQRDSPSLAIVHRLLAEGAVVQAFDPTVTAHSIFIPESVRLFDTALGAATGAAALAVFTEWPEFARVPATEVAAVMPGRAVVDGRNLLDRDAWREAGFQHLAVGR
jgi:UDPglucose 6-dehydrogenase